MKLSSMSMVLVGFFFLRTMCACTGKSGNSSSQPLSSSIAPPLNGTKAAPPVNTGVQFLGAGTWSGDRVYTLSINPLPNSTASIQKYVVSFSYKYFNSSSDPNSSIAWIDLQNDIFWTDGSMTNGQLTLWGSCVQDEDGATVNYAAGYISANEFVLNAAQAHGCGAEDFVMDFKFSQGLSVVAFTSTENAPNDPSSKDPRNLSWTSVVKSSANGNSFPQMQPATSNQNQTAPTPADAARSNTSPISSPASPQGQEVSNSYSLASLARHVNYNNFEMEMYPQTYARESIC